MNPARFIRWAFGACRFHSPGSLFATQTRSYERGCNMLRLYYAVFLVLAIVSAREWWTFFHRPVIWPLWPVLWLRYLPNPYLGEILILSVFYAGAVCVFLRPDARWARVLAAAGIFLFGALFNSYGKVSHFYHTWVLTAFVFVFLPDGWASVAHVPRLRRQQLLQVIWLAQAIVLLTYSMAGIGKLWEASHHVLQGHVSILSPDALARFAASRLIEVHRDSLLVDFIVDHHYAGWPLMLLTLYAEFFAFWAAFRPRLHRAWGLVLIAFHIGTYLLLELNFQWAALLLGILLLYSPFASPQDRWGAFVLDLPGVALAGSLVGRVRGRLLARNAR